MNFLDEFKRKRKGCGKAYLLVLLCLAHNFYIKRGFGLWLLQNITFPIGVGVVWLIIDLFKLPSIVKELNQDIAKEILRDIKVLQAS